MSNSPYNLENDKDDRKKKTLRVIASWQSAEILNSWDSEEIEENNPYLTANAREKIASKDWSNREKIIIQRLTMKSFHLPGNSYWQDWFQFVRNNHLVLGFCMADPLHPFSLKERVLNLLASLAFGLAATSIVALWYYYNKEDMNQVILPLPFGYGISHGMFTTGFFGGFVNVLWDFSIWFLQACPCVQPGGFLAERLSSHAIFFWIWMGSNLAMIVTIISICLAVHFVTIRASVNDDGNDEGYATGIIHYKFIATFLLQAVIAQFIMFPVVAFTIFSGVLGCFRLPGIGGRPYQERRARNKRRKENRPVEI
mmetsp:Transcript_4501/g.5210  ORF Transcript_4501/g.5210 Transcript_4501/m.5210 type:complete len:312 (+) Transcript_4501:24-959(+)|eukprot:CAMPEP_0194133286 /NCGR_PEP_ID=MMETSP0152-20130528/3527_1 /TAXON_ID=1049557 /ORGANISM="Thalassiothrix antarctica, Strain L6-D1" /LENGTH=311 /DNA_ID=CAMNT_0038828579 /DNA_START=28 /DNA_END=963 /DNA_ORIENTATION=+